MSGRMNIATVYSAFTTGMTAEITSIEVSLSQGINIFEIIGLCDSSIKESRGRINAALKSNGFMMPRGHITVSISPSYMHKSGTGFDLPIAIGILAVSNQIRFDPKQKIYASGELSLKGDVLETPGSIIRLSEVKKTDFDKVFAPSKEANSIWLSGVDCSLLSNLSDLRNIEGLNKCSVLNGDFLNVRPDFPLNPDLSMLKGQFKTSRAIEIAAAGWHNILFIGTAGSGKTLGAEILYNLLPELSSEEFLDVYKIRNQTEISGDGQISLLRPFVRMLPDSGMSKLYGSSSKLIPGDIPLSHNGVLFADEMCEMGNKTIDLLRQPIEKHIVTLKRDGKAYDFPSECLFVGATNPCRCGNLLSNPSKCNCPTAVRKTYANRLSNPFFERIDIVTEMHEIDEEGLKAISGKTSEYENERIRERIRIVRQIQAERYSEFGLTNMLNGKYEGDNLSEVFRCPETVTEHAVKAASLGGFSPRSYKRLMKVGRTIADLDERTDMTEKDINEALTYKLRRII